VDWHLVATEPHGFADGALLHGTLTDTGATRTSWDVSVHVRAGHGRLIIDQLQVQPAPDTEFIAMPGLQGAIVFPDGQRLSLAQARREISAVITTDLAREKPSNWPAIWRLALGLFDPTIKVPRPGRKGRPAYDHALIAAAYVSAAELNPSSVYKAMIPLLASKGRRYRPTSLPKAVLLARRLGYLTEAPAKGRAGGSLTPHATATLEAHGFDGFVPTNDRIPVPRTAGVAQEPEQSPASLRV
jgi:hypothetical protein